MVKISVKPMGGIKFFKYLGCIMNHSGGIEAQELSHLPSTKIRGKSTLYLLKAVQPYLLCWL